MKEINWMQQGWECPKCGAVMAPHVDCCVNCRGHQGGGTVTTVINPVIVKENWTGYPPINNPTCVSSKEDSEDQWDRYYLNVKETKL